MHRCSAQPSASIPFSLYLPTILQLHGCTNPSEAYATDLRHSREFRGQTEHITWGCCKLLRYVCTKVPQLCAKCSWMYLQMMRFEQEQKSLVIQVVLVRRFIFTERTSGETILVSNSLMILIGIEQASQTFNIMHIAFSTATSTESKQFSVMCIIQSNQWWYTTGSSSAIRKSHSFPHRARKNRNKNLLKTCREVFEGRVVLARSYKSENYHINQLDVIHVLFRIHTQIIP